MYTYICTELLKRHLFAYVSYCTIYLSIIFIVLLYSRWLQNISFVVLSCTSSQLYNRWYVHMSVCLSVCLSHAGID